MLYQLLTRSVPFTAPTAEGLMRQHLEMPVPSLSSRQPDLPGGVRGRHPDRACEEAGATLSPRPASSRLPSTLWGSGPDGRFGGQTNLAPVGPLATAADLGPTMHVARQQLQAEKVARPSRAGAVNAALVALALVLVVLLAGAVGYIAAGGRLVPRRRSCTDRDRRECSDPAGAAAQAKTETQPPPATSAPPPAPGCAAEADRAPTDSNCE